jgi:proteasome accessory factor B
MGIPITTTVIDVLFDDEVGYRIDSNETTLPAISFEPDEVAALALAARAWSTASISGAASAGLRKLRLSGVEIDESVAAGAEPRILTREPAFEAVHAALSALQPITFDYRRNDGKLTTRRVQPWALKNWHGRWYLTGYDLDREDERAFRLSRVEGAVRKLGRAGAYTVPDDYEPDVALEQQATAPVGTARVRLRHGRGHTLRRHALSVTELDERWSEVEVPYWRGSTERDVVALGQHAVALSPPELVDAVRSTLTAAAEANEGTPS